MSDSPTDSRAPSPWMPVRHEDRYHGKILTRDSRAFWVFPRLHRSAGWCVEVRDGAPDGVLLGRTWHESILDAGVAVASIRERFSRQQGGAFDGEVVEPPDDRGVLVAHGFKGRGSPCVGVDGGIATMVCVVFWLPPGPHDVAWVTAIFDKAVCNRTVDVVSHQAVHVYGTEVHELVSRLPPTLPFWHRCRDARIAFDGDLVPAKLLGSDR